MGYKHYIKLNGNDIYDYFSSAFMPEEDDAIEIRDCDDRHFYIEIDGAKVYNPPLLTDDFEYNLEYIDSEVRIK